MLWLITYIALGALFLYGTYPFIKDKRYRLPPGPLPLPFVGNFVWFFCNRQSKPWRVVADATRQYKSDILTFYFGLYRVIGINNSQLMHEALVQKGRVFNDRPDVIRLGMDSLQLGILASSGDIWQRRRRFAMRAMRDFGMGKNAMAVKVQDEAQYLVAELEQLGSKPFVPRELITNAVSNVISSLVFGKRFHYDDKMFQELQLQIEQMMTMPPEYNAIFFVFPLSQSFLRPPTAVKLTKIMDIVGEMANEAIEEHRKDFEADHIRDFPDLYIQAERSKEAMPFDDLKGYTALMVDMFLAGSETTTTSLNWALLYLTKWPSVQRKCQETIDQVIRSDRLPTIEDRPKLAYVEATMCEVMRFATTGPVGILHENPTSDVTIGGYDVPAGSILMYNLWALDHDEEYWNDPFEFRPERFLDRNGKLISHGSQFIPFGIGPRACPGELLAKTEYFIFFVAMLHRFNLCLHEDSKNVDINDGSIGPAHAPPRYKVVAEKRF